MTKKPPIDEAKSGTVPTTADTAKSASRTRLSSLIVLAVGLIVTGSATLYMRSSVERIAEQEFVAHCTEIQNKIVARLFEHARILRSTQAFINASDTVTREKWNIYTRLQKLEQQLPGIQGIGFSLLIPSEELARHIRKIRSEGFPKYKIKPEGERESYSSIIYLEPFDWRNQRAFGYDMLTEPVRRAAMEKSRDDDKATLSGKVLLVQETDAEVQAGNLMYVPVYRKSMPTDTAEQRRAAIYGWVYSPYRMHDLMHGILGNPDPGKQKGLFLDVFDGEKTSPQSLLYEDHLPQGHQLWTNVQFTKQMPVDFNGRRWTLSFTQTGDGFFSVDYINVWLSMLGGTIITLLLFVLIRTLQNTAAVAQRLVDERTEQLTKITNELSIIVENAPFGISKIIDRKQVWVNRKMEDLFQYSKEEMEFQTTRKLYTSDEAYEKFGQEAYPALSQGLVYETVQELIRKDGAHLFVRYIGKAVEPPDMSKGTIWLLEDVTERKQAEEMLIHERNLSMDIINTQPSGIYRSRVFAPNTWKKDAWRSSSTSPYVIELASEPFCKILGTTKEAFVNNPGMVIDLTHPDDREGFAKRNEEAAVNLEEFFWEGRLLIDGVIRWVRCQSLPRPLENGDVLWTGTLIDITALKRAEEEKLALEHQLHQAQKMESLGVLAGGIAHDFNNILAVIMCYSNLAQQKPEKAAEFMPEIEKASERAAGLCRQMLAYAGKTQFVQSKVDMTALVDDTLGILKSSLPQNVTVKPYLTGDIPHIQGDAGQLRQTVMNLMINASEAIGEEQGDILVALTKTKISAVEAEKDHLGKAITPGSYLCLEVTDTGCGMDNETKLRIFEPFYSTKFVGRGLGMSAVLGVVTSHNGALQLMSQVGQGTTVKVYLPVLDGCSTQQISSASWQGSGTILLVEDEPQLMDVAKELLEMLGFSVIEALNGVEGIEQYRKNADDIRLVLTDIGMPLMNGYELVRELKQINPMLPIIVSSGFGDTDVISRIAHGDIAGLISKPYSFDQLREVLEEVLEKS